MGKLNKRYMDFVPVCRLLVSFDIKTTGAYVGESTLKNPVIARLPGVALQVGSMIYRPTIF